MEVFILENFSRAQKSDLKIRDVATMQRVWAERELGAWI